MKFPSNIWNQLKNKTSRDFIRALEKDKWERDVTSGAEQIYRHPDGRRISIHFHPNRTYKPKLLQALIKDTGWSEEDMKRLGFIK